MHHQSHYIGRPLRRAIGLLIAAAIFQLLAYIVAPQMILAAQNFRGLLGLALEVITGFIAAKTIHDLMHIFLPATAEPWYARPKSLGRLILLLLLACPAATAVMINYSELRQVPIPAVAFEFLAIALLGIALLDWPAAGSAYTTYNDTDTNPFDTMPPMPPPYESPPDFTGDFDSPPSSPPPRLPKQSRSYRPGR